MTEKAERKTRSQRRSPAVTAVLVFCFMAGAGLLGLGVPRTIAAWTAFPTLATVDAVEQNRSVPFDDMSASIEALRRSLPWDASAVRATSLAMLEHVLAMQMPLDDERRDKLIAAAEADNITGLLRNPADGFAWFRLANLRDLRKAPPRDVAVALIQSIDLTPNMDPIWLPRAAMLFAYLTAFTREEIEVVRAQIRTVWTGTPRPHQQLQGPLMEIANRSSRLAVLGAFLADDPVLYGQYLAKRQELYGR
jgi:hypothetical protein